jgi:flavin-dependent dehydrogenase
MQPNAGLPRRAEIVVIGGGPAGAVAALTLARSGVTVALVEAGAGRHPPVGETLPPAVRPVLDRLGLRTMVAAEGYLPSIGNWSAWGGAEPWGRDFMFNRFGHGWHLDRRRFDALLREAARAAGARLAVGASVAASAPLAGGGFRMNLANGGEIDARIVLDASGRCASFARQRGVKRATLDRMVALVGYVVRRADAEAEPAATLVEATADGWWYSAPLPQDRLATVFMTDTDIARASGASAESWLDRLAAAPHTGARALRYGAGLAGPPAMVPAASSRLLRFGDADWLAIGDAAATQDPLSSEGILVAMESGFDGAAAAARTLRGDRDALAAAVARREASWLGYLDQRNRYYDKERRWPDAPFWRRRGGRELREPAGQLREQRSVA